MDDVFDFLPGGQELLDYTFVPRSDGLIVDGSLSTIALMASFCPKPLVAAWMLAASGGPAWLA